MKDQPLEMKWYITSFSISDLGMKRSNNEDWVAGYEPDDPEDRQFSGFLYIVADGVGGASRGERASQYAAQKVLYEYYHYPDTPPEERLKVLIRRAGNEIHQFAIDNGTARMATTMVAAVVRGDMLTIANVGDSRGYLIRDGQIVQITRDHNLADELVRNGSITSEEAKHSKTRNKLMRSLGGESDVEVDIFKNIELVPGDLILLCSDGLTRYATNEDLLQFSKEGLLDEIGNKMIDFANQCGGADNISVYLIKVSSSFDETPKSTFGRMPEPVDWDTMQTQSNTIKIKPKHNKKLHKISPFIFYGLAAMILVVVVGGSILLSLTGRQNKNPSSLASPTSTEVITIAPDLPEQLPGLTDTPNPLLKNNEPDFDENLPTPTEEDTFVFTTPESSGVFICIHEVQSGEWISVIYSDYSPPPSTLGPYYRFSNCDLELKNCTGPELVIEDENNVSVGVFLKIPEILKDNCKSVENSHWVNIINP